MPENYVNNFTNMLDGSIDSTQTTMDLVSVTGAPEPICRFLIEQELVVATLRAGNTYTIERGAEGTTADSHADATPVIHLLTAGALNQIHRDMVVKAPFADAGDYTKPGFLFLPQVSSVGTPEAAGSNIVMGSSGPVSYGPFWQMKRPLLSDFTTHNSPTINDQGGVLYIHCPANSGDFIRGLKRSYSGKIRFKVCFAHFYKVANYAFVGIGWRSSSNDREQTFICNEALSGRSFGVANFINSAYNSSPVGNNGMVGYGHFLWLMAEDDGTNLKYYWSPDGRTYFQYGGNQGRTSFITGGPDQIFIFVNSNNSTIPVEMTLFSYEEESFV